MVTGGVNISAGIRSAECCSVGLELSDPDRLVLGVIRSLPNGKRRRTATDLVSPIIPVSPMYPLSPLARWSPMAATEGQVAREVRERLVPGERLQDLVHVAKNRLVVTVAPRLVQQVRPRVVQGRAVGEGAEQGELVLGAQPVSSEHVAPFQPEAHLQV